MPCKAFATDPRMSLPATTSLRRRLPWLFQMFLSTCDITPPTPKTRNAALHKAQQVSLEVDSRPVQERDLLPSLDA